MRRTLHKEIRLALDAWMKAADARKALDDLLTTWRNAPSHGEIISYAQLKKAEDGIRAFEHTMNEVATLLDRKCCELQARFDNVVVLEAVIRCGDLSRKIIVAKPNERIANPFINERFFTAIRNKWNVGGVITTDEDYDILVVNGKGKTVAVIEGQ